MWFGQERGRSAAARASCCLAQQQSAVAKWRRRFYCQIATSALYTPTPVSHGPSHLQPHGSQHDLLFNLRLKPTVTRSLLASLNPHEPLFLSCLFSRNTRQSFAVYFFSVFAILFLYTIHIYLLLYLCGSLRQLKKI